MNELELGRNIKTWTEKLLFECKDTTSLLSSRKHKVYGR